MVGSIMKYHLKDFKYRVINLNTSLTYNLINKDAIQVRIKKKLRHLQEGQGRQPSR